MKAKIFRGRARIATAAGGAVVALLLSVLMFVPDAHAQTVFTGDFKVEDATGFPCTPNGTITNSDLPVLNGSYCRPDGFVPTQGLALCAEVSSQFNIDYAYEPSTANCYRAVFNVDATTCQAPSVLVQTIIGAQSGQTFSLSSACALVMLAPVGSSQVCNGHFVSIDMNTNGGNGTGTSAVDVILGTPGADTINALGGHDIVCAGGGNDTVRGGAGDDWIDGQAGEDTIRGGGGGDTIFGGVGADVLDGQGGSDTIDGGAGGDTISGRGAGDVIAGGGGGDVIDGQNGVDMIDGGAGDDEIKGQTGPDELRGGGGNDDLFGGNGNDTLYGDAGTDKCAGNFGPADRAQAATCETTPGVEILF